MLDSRDSNHSSKFTVSVVVAFTKKKEENRHISRKERAAIRANTQSSVSK